MSTRKFTTTLPTSVRHVAAAFGFLLLPLGPMDAASPAGAGQIRFSSGPIVTTAKSPAELAAGLTALAFRQEARHMVVQFHAPLTKDDRAWMTAHGLNLLRPLGDQAWFAAFTTGVDIPALAGSGRLVDAFDIEPLWKLHPYLAEGNLPVWAVVDRLNLADGVSEQDLLAAVRGLEDPTIAMYILFHPDVPLDPDAVTVAADSGARIVSLLETINGMVIELPFSRMWHLASQDAVQYLEPALPPLKELNDSNRNRVGANTVHAPPYGLDGTGVNVLVYDGGKALPTHQDFGGRLTVGATDTSGTSNHATHVSGTVGGSGAASAGLRKGMAPNVAITSFGFEQEGGLMQGFLYTDPGDLEEDYTAAVNTYGADISNNSIGTNTSTNGYPCSWQGDYGVTDVLIDSIVRGALGAPFRIVWANGNERQSSRCENLPPPHQDYHLTAPPACAKNHITVGALNSNDDSMTTFSSWGPADDGRMKPDISAPGCEAGGDNGVTSCSSSGGYSSLCGTSMASPTVCGLAALLLQDFRAQYPGEPDPRNSTLKILFAHTAVDVFNPGPDYQSGYGSVRIQPAVDLLRSGNFLEAEVDQGDMYQLLIVVNPGDPVLKATLAWDDFPGTPNTTGATVLVNDLDLRVFAPGGGQLFPWTLNPAIPSANAVRTVPDHINNIEQVYLANPEPGVYRVEVVGFNVPQGPQAFSLAGGPIIVDCSPAGVISLDRVKYACSSEAVIQVVDCDLNANDLVIETVNVTIASSSEPAGETVTLTETGPETAAFRADITLSTTNAPGVLLVAHGDIVTTTYIDADDGQGGFNIVRTDTAEVDCSPPSVNNVAVTNLEARSATITFTTREPASATVMYGTSCASLTGAAAGSGFQTSHAINLTGLEDNTGYFFAIQVVDQAGNSAVNDNGGACYFFATPEVPDFFTEEFGSDNDTDNRAVLFTPNNSADFYSACGFPIAALPTPTAGHTAVPLSDDGSASVALVGGMTAKLYGASYSSVWINANGNLTFLASDGDYTETLTDHFDTPRVAALFDDLNPATGGQVVRAQLADRFVVSWLNVPEYSTSNQNTFQIELYFDGRIQLSWLSIAAADGIAGLSEGQGLSPDFLETDLSGIGICGPTPPEADSQALTTPMNSPIAIELSAEDDGLPDPPGALSYKIITLPQRTLRDAGNNHVIVPADLPYTLSGGGNELLYIPGTTFEGTDSFQFRANDGGSPPQGGDSNLATVSIAVGGPQPVYVFDLDTDPDWTVMGQWAWGTPTGGGSFNRDPTGGFTGTKVYGYNLAGDYPNNLSPVQYLTTKPINCTGLTSTQLRFRRWLGVESATADHANIQISADNVNWSTVWNHTGATISENAWSLQTYDISAFADNQPGIRIRWGMGTTDPSVSYPGWNIDDIAIWAEVPAPGIPGDLNNDGVVDITDLLAMLEDWGPCPPPCPADINGDGVVDITDLLELLANWTTPQAREPAPILAAGPSGGGGSGMAPEAALPATEAADDRFMNDGVLAPALRGGVIELDRGFLQTARGSLEIEVAGARPVDEHDLLIVAGEATLGGTLTVRLADGYLPQDGDRFVIVAAEALRGEFEHLVLPKRPAGEDALRVEYGQDSVALVPAAAGDPAPARALGLSITEADINGDGVVSIRDVSTLLRAWGTAGAAGGRSADLNADSAVNGDDLRLLLELWR